MGLPPKLIPKTTRAHRSRPWTETDRVILWRLRKRVREAAAVLNRTQASCRRELVCIAWERAEREALRQIMRAEALASRSKRVEMNRRIFRAVVAERNIRDRLDDTRARDNGGFLPPTEAMKKRQRPDVVLKLLNAKSISQAEHDAAMSIRHILYVIGKGLFPQRSLEDLGTHIDGGSPYRDPLGRMTKTEYETWSKVFMPWANAMAKVRVGQSGRHLRDLVQDIVTDNWGPSQIDRAYGLPRGKGRATKYLKQGLEDYARRAGFISRGRRAA